MRLIDEVNVVFITRLIFRCAGGLLVHVFICTCLLILAPMLMQRGYLNKLNTRIQIRMNQLLILIEKFSPLLGFEPRTSEVTGRCATN